MRRVKLEMQVSVDGFTAERDGNTNWMFVNPVALGEGRSMFKDIDTKLSLNLVTATAHDCGVVVLKYALKK